MFDILSVVERGVMQTKYERSIERMKNLYEGHSLVTFLASKKVTTFVLDKTHQIESNEN